MSAPGTERREPRSIPGSTSPGSLLLFFAATFAVTWACFITVAMAVPAHSPLGTLLILFGAYTPSLVALSITAVTQGREGVRALLGRVVKWEVAARWYVFAAFYVVAIKL